MTLRFALVSLVIAALACSLPVDTGTEPTELVVEVGTVEPDQAQDNSVPSVASAEPDVITINPEIDSAPQTEFNTDGLNIGPGQGFIVLDNPDMIPASEASWLQADDVVLGVEQNGEAQAFPINQMAYHHIANTRIGGEPYLVTY